MSNCEKYAKFDRPIGHLFHYGHFIVDGVLPLLSVYESFFTNHPHCETLTLVLEDCMNNHFGGLQSILLYIYPKLRLTYVPKSVMDTHVSSTSTITGFAFGPYDPSVISCFDRYIASICPSSCPSTHNLVLCIERGYQPLTLPSKFGADLCDTGIRRRHLQNHSNVVEILEAWAREKGLEFKNVQLEGMHWRDQQSLFKRARLVFGQHGAGMTNIVFCTPNSETVILEASPCLVQCIENLANVKNLRHHYIQGDNTSCNLQSLKDTLSIL